MKVFKKLIFLSVSAVVAGCSFFKGDDNKEPPVHLKSVTLSLDSDANQDSALAIDLLMIYKKELLDAVMKMKARDYYLSAMQLKRDYPEMLDIWHWELTPGQVVKDYPITHRCTPPLGAVFFADYLTPGDHRVRFGPQVTAHVRAKQFDFCVLEQGCSSDLQNRSIVSKRSGSTPQSQAISGGMKKGSESQGGQGNHGGQGGSQGNPLATLKKVEKSAQSEIKSFKQDIKEFKKLF